MCIFQQVGPHRDMKLDLLTPKLEAFILVQCPKLVKYVEHFSLQDTVSQYVEMKSVRHIFT